MWLLGAVFRGEIRDWAGGAGLELAEELADGVGVHGEPFVGGENGAIGAVVGQGSNGWEVGAVSAQAPSNEGDADCETHDVGRVAGQAEDLQVPVRLHELVGEVLTALVVARRATEEHDGSIIHVSHPNVEIVRGPRSSREVAESKCCFFLHRYPPIRRRSVRVEGLLYLMRVELKQITEELALFGVVGLGEDLLPAPQPGEEGLALEDVPGCCKVRHRAAKPLRVGQ